MKRIVISVNNERVNAPLILVIRRIVEKFMDHEGSGQYDLLFSFYDEDDDSEGTAPLHVAIDDMQREIIEEGFVEKVTVDVDHDRYEDEEEDLLELLLDMDVEDMASRHPILREMYDEYPEIMKQL